ncbi:MAG: acetate--CoA ligase family protein [Promethearchaeota archaeon]
MSNLKFFFEPKTVAIIGASERLKFGYGTTKYLLESPFKTYPVSLTKNQIMGHKAYKSIKEIPEEIELAIILVKNDNVLQAVKECVEKGVKGIIIETAGFAETSIPKYVSLQEQIASLAKSSGVRIIGPNCVGITNFKNKFTTTELDVNKLVKGNISIIAQSGVLGNIFIDWATSQKIGFSKAITLGNKIDVDEIDMIEYLEEDPDTSVITIYLEGVKRGNTFKFVLKNMKKPLIILKNGRSELGAKAIKSHTASLAGNDRIFEALFRQFKGIFRVNNFYEMFEIAQVFATQPLPKGKNIAIITGSGSLGILACDLIEKEGLGLAKLESKSMEELRAISPNWVSVKNPVDLGPSQFSTLNPALNILFHDKKVDGVLFIFSVPELPLKQWSLSVTPFLRRMKHLSRETEKPIIICVFGSRWVFEYLLEKAVKFSIPLLNRIDHAIKAFRFMHEFYLHKKE